MRIYTYKSPYDIDKMDIWQDIKKYPHLCVSQTLVEGMKAYYGRDNFEIICTVDNLLRKMYSEWHDNTETLISQHVRISQVIDSLPEPTVQTKNLKKAMKHNKRDVIQAIRYLIESEIDGNINESFFSDEQKMLFEIYRIVEDENLFTGLYRAKNNSLDEIHECFVDVLRSELSKYIEDDLKQELRKISIQTQKKEYDSFLIKALRERIKNIRDRSSQRIAYNGIKFIKEKRNEWIEDNRVQAIEQIQKLEWLIKTFKKYKDDKIFVDYSKIIIHGVHQFNPLILKLIRDLEEQNIEIIFMFNYMEEYREIYKTWEHVYEWVGKENQLERLFIQEGQEYLAYRELGYSLSNLYEGDFSKISSYDDINYICYDNLTSFSDYVAKQYEIGKANYEEKSKNKDAQAVNSKLSILANMDEQFYAINGTEMNELLKLYFPEQFSKRHFLSYPIGQFIKSLYDMWDDYRETIVITEESLKEALALTVWNRSDMPTPLEIYHNLQHYFKRAETFEDYQKCLNNIWNLVRKSKERQIKCFSFFIYSDIEIEYFGSVLSEILHIAEGLFSSKKSGLREHYKKLIDEILSNQSIKMNITDQELQLVNAIKDRLNHIQPLKEEARISDIKETIGYYLKVNTSNSEYEAEWIVRDFEQIDGGILIAAAQRRANEEKNSVKNKKEQAIKTFHYGGLSDENMSGKTRVALPWPLDEKLFSNMDNQNAEICSRCRREYNYFLRYSLFYGTYFLTNDRQITLSYIKKLGDQNANPYSPLILMNMKIKEYFYDQAEEEENSLDVYSNEYDTHFVPPTKDLSQQRSMRACFKRYLFNYCLDKNTYFNDEFYLDCICKFFIMYKYVVEHRNEKYGEQIKEDRFNNYVRMFPFLSPVDIEEIKNDILKELSSETPFTFNSTYTWSKMEFIYKKWEEQDDESRKDVFAYFTKYPKKGELENVYRAFESWIEDSSVEVETRIGQGKVCEVCNQRYLCYTYRKDEEIMEVD